MVYTYKHICSGLCAEDLQGTVNCQRGYPAIVLAKGGSGDLGCGDQQRTVIKTRTEPAVVLLQPQPSVSCQCHELILSGYLRDFCVKLRPLLPLYTA